MKLVNRKKKKESSHSAALEGQWS